MKMSQWQNISDHRATETLFSRHPWSIIPRGWYIGDHVRPVGKVSLFRKNSICSLKLLHLCVLCGAVGILFAIAKLLIHFLGIYDDLEIAELSLQYRYTILHWYFWPYARYHINAVAPQRFFTSPGGILPSIPSINTSLELQLKT